MSESKAAPALLGALALFGASLGVSPAAQAQGWPQAQPSPPAGVESNQKKWTESNQVKGDGLMRRLPGWLGRAGAVADAVRQPSLEGTARALGAMSGSQASTQAGGGGGGAQGGVASLKLDAGAMSIAAGGILRCEEGQEVTLGLTGEDASMNRIPLEPLSPEARSTNDGVVRAAMSSGSSYVVNVRCVSDGEAWVVADAGGRRAVFPVLVGRARRQPAMTTQAPLAAASAVAPVGQATRPKVSPEQVGRAADAARSIFNAIRR